MINIKSKNDLVLWFTFKDFSSTVDNIFYGGAYLAPEE